MKRFLDASREMLRAAKGEDVKFKSVHDHQSDLDSLSREIRLFTATAFQVGQSPAEADLVASLIEEEDFCASLCETLYQVARRIERQAFGPEGLEQSKTIVELVERVVAARLDQPLAGSSTVGEKAMQDLVAMRHRVVANNNMPAEDRGALLALLGSAERVFYLAERIQSERASVSRDLARTALGDEGSAALGGEGLVPRGA